MNKAVVFFVIVIVFFITIQSCVHHPGEPIPQPIDTSGHDTTIIIPKHPCSPDTVYYGRDIQPLFNTYCTGISCHNPPSPREGLNVTSYSGVMSSGKVNVFNGSGSKLYQSLNAGGGDRMPPTGALSSANKALIKKWIDQGAKNLWCDDMMGPCDTISVNYANTISKIMTDNGCVNCHGTSGNPVVNLTTYAGVKAAAMDNSRLWNAVNHLSGASKAMPNNTTFLSKCNIRQIKIWIDAGYPQ